MPSATAVPAKNLDILTEEVISLDEAAKLIPRRPHRATVYRWAKNGCHGTKLETCKIGHGLVTSVQAVTRFLNAIQG